MSLSPDTVAWLRSLPKPDDTEGWEKRQQQQFAAIFGTPDEPLPMDECCEICGEPLDCQHTGAER